MNHHGPNLVEPSLKNYLVEKLKTCHHFKSYYYNIYYNGCMFLLFTTIISVFVFTCYKGKISPLEKEVQLEKKNIYILNKIKQIQQRTQQTYQGANMITDLPRLTDDFGD